ncbi:MAG: hypothetical protein RL235_623 [Chlamydiota bacterium]|jgi:hypothetical protein
MALADTMRQLSCLAQALIRDLVKVDRGNKTAAQRVRVQTLSLAKIGKKFRKESISLQKSGRFRKKKKKPRRRT